MCLVVPVNTIVAVVLLMSPLPCARFHVSIWFNIFATNCPSAATGSTRDDGYRTDRMGTAHPTPEISDRGRSRDATGNSSCFGDIQKVRVVHRSAAVMCSLCGTWIGGNYSTRVFISYGGEGVAKPGRGSVFLVGGYTSFLFGACPAVSRACR